MDNSYFLPHTVCHIYVSNDTVVDTYIQHFTNYHFAQKIASITGFSIGLLGPELEIMHKKS